MCCSADGLSDEHNIEIKTRLRYGKIPNIENLCKMLMRRKFAPNFVQKAHEMPVRKN